MAKTVIQPRRDLAKPVAPSTIAKLNQPIKPSVDELVAQGKVFTEGGTGRRQCPECECYTKFQFRSCPVCGYEFARKPRGEGGSKAKSGITLNASTLKALKVINSFTDSFEDSAAALSTLDKVEAVIEVFGSFAAAKEAIEALADDGEESL